MKSTSITPESQMLAHHKARFDGIKVLSILCGQPSEARAVWGKWCSFAKLAVRIPPDYSFSSLETTLKFYQRRYGSQKPAVGLLIVPTRSNREILNEAIAFSNKYPYMAIGIVLDTAFVSSLLYS